MNHLKQCTVNLDKRLFKFSSLLWHSFGEGSCRLPVLVGILIGNEDVIPREMAEPLNEGLGLRADEQQNTFAPRRRLWFA